MRNCLLSLNSPVVKDGLLSRGDRLQTLPSSQAEALENEFENKGSLQVREAQVLSIQSHVVHGYVGNKSAVLPLQLLGLEVDAINSVQFSNHTGYPTFKGTVFDGKHLLDIVDGLESNGLLQHTHLLTGYIGSLSLLEAVEEVVRRLKKHTDNLTYVCDPVMGDEGRLYVHRDLVDAFRCRLLPLANVVVPNQFEAELLTQLPQPMATLRDAARVCDMLHEAGPHTVVLTSVSLLSRPGVITLVASTTQPQTGPLAAGASGGGCTRVAMFIPKIEAYFTGTGDLLASLLLAQLHHHPGDLPAAVNYAVSSLQGILEGTAKHAAATAAKGQTNGEMAPSAAAAAAATESSSGKSAAAVLDIAGRTSATCAARELRLVALRRMITHPPQIPGIQCLDLDELLRREEGEPAAAKALAALPVEAVVYASGAPRG